MSRRRNMSPTVKMKRVELEIESLIDRILENLDISDAKLNAAINYAKLLVPRIRNKEIVEHFIDTIGQAIIDIHEMYELIQYGSERR